MMGGQLARPHDRWPGVFSHPFWVKFPYFLPCAVSAAFSAFTFVMTALFLKEVRQIDSDDGLSSDWLIPTDCQTPSSARTIVVVRNATARAGRRRSSPCFRCSDQAGHHINSELWHTCAHRDCAPRVNAPLLCDADRARRIRPYPTYYWHDSWNIRPSRRHHPTVVLRKSNRQIRSQARFPNWVFDVCALVPSVPDYKHVRQSARNYAWCLGVGRNATDDACGNGHVFR